MSEGFFAETVAALAVEPLAFLLVEASPDLLPDASPVFVDRLSSTYTSGFAGAFLAAVVDFEVVGFAVVDFEAPDLAVDPVVVELFEPCGVVLCRARADWAKTGAA